MIVRTGFALAISSFIAWRGYKKKSLSLDGAVAAFVTGIVHAFAGYSFTVALLLFFFTSSYWTKYKSDIKKKIEEDFKEGGQRTAIQVISNSLPASVMCCIYIALYGLEYAELNATTAPLRTALLCAVLGYYACCNGDTWASELGVLSKKNPILITTLQPVHKGTNGAISLEGTLASAAAGLTIGIGFYLTQVCLTGFFWQHLPLVGLGLLGGLIGSILDSLMGATIQYSGYDPTIGKVVSKPTPTSQKITGVDLLDNHQVNFASSLVTCLLFAALGPLFF